MLGFFNKLKSGLNRTSNSLVTGIGNVFTKRRLDAEAIEELEDLLLMADVGYAATSKLSQNLSKEKFGKEVADEEVRHFLSKEIAGILEPIAKPLVIDRTQKPYVILFAGVNGAGKTTSIGKLAQKFTSEGLKVSLVAGDTFRAAAVEQLKVWGERSGCPVYSAPDGADAAGLIYDSYQQSKKHGDDILLIDTAGRLQNKSTLMSELEKIVRVIKKIDASAPHSCILVLDATVGQNAHLQVEAFSSMLGVTGMIVTKLDGTAKGGVVVALADKFKIPVHYIGVGESADDLQPFTAEDYAAILMGVK